MADTLQPVVDKLKKSLGETAKEFEGFKQETAKIAGEFGSSMSESAKKLDGALDSTDKNIRVRGKMLDKGLGKFQDKMMAGGLTAWNDFANGLSMSALKDGDKLWGKIGENIPDIQFSKSFKNIGDALNELTGFDLNKVVKDATDKIKAGWTIATAPFTLLNDAVKKVSGFFGKEIDLLGKGKELFMKGMTALGGGLKKLSGYLLQQGIFLGKAALQFLASATTFILRGLLNISVAFLRITAQLVVASIGMAFQALLFIGGLIASGISMAVAAAGMIAAAAPIIGIALLIGLGVAAIVMAGMFIYRKFQENKDYIFAKFTAMKQKVSDIVGNITGFFSKIWQNISDFIREKILKIKSFLGLTSDEEEKELEGIKKRKAKKKENEEKATQMAMQELRGDEEFQNASQMQKMRMIQKRQKLHFEKLDQQAQFDEMDTQALLDERKAKQEELKGKQDALDARNEYIFMERQADSDAADAEKNRIEKKKESLDAQIERDMENSTIRHNGVILEGDAKRQFLMDMQAGERDALVEREAQMKAQAFANEEKYETMQEQADLGILRDKEGNMVGGDAYAYTSTERLQGEANELSNEVGAMQGSLKGREDYVPAKEISDEEVAITMGFNTTEIDAAKSLMAEGGEFAKMGLLDTLELAKQRGLTQFSDRGAYADEDIYRSEDVARTELSGMQDTTTAGQDMASSELEKGRFELQKQRQEAQVEEYKMYGNTDPKSNVFQNVSQTNVSGYSRMEDPQAINRKAAASAGNDYDDLGF